jgi:hypothetical protein
MNIEDIVVVATVREEIRRQKPFVDTAGLERRIEAAQVKVAVHVASDDDPSSESEAAEEELPKAAVTGTIVTANSYNGTNEVASAITPNVVDMHRSDEHSVSPYVVWLVNGTESLTRHRDCKVGAAASEDSSARFPPKRGKKKKGKKGCDLGENTGANMAKSETIPGEGEAEHVADTISKEGGEKGPARPYPGGLFGPDAGTPSTQPVTQTTGQGLFGLPQGTPSSQTATQTTGQGLFGLPQTPSNQPVTLTTPGLFGSLGSFGSIAGGSVGGWGTATGSINGGSGTT